MEDYNVEQKKDLKHKLRTQLLLEHHKPQKAKTRAPHSIVQTFSGVLSGSYRSAQAGAVKFCALPPETSLRDSHY